MLYKQFECMYVAECMTHFFNYRNDGLVLGDFHLISYCSVLVTVKVYAEYPTSVRCFLNYLRS